MATNKTNGHLPLVFAGGLVATLMATCTGAIGLRAGIALLSDRSSAYVPESIGWLINGSASSYAGLITVSVISVLAALAGGWLINKTRKQAKTDQSFTETPVYRGLFFTAIAVAGVMSLVATAAALAVVIVSLLTLGGDVSTKNLYIDNFVPTIITAVVTASIALLLFGAFNNKKGHVTWLVVVLLALSGTTLALNGVAVGIKSHAGTTTTTKNTTTTDTKTDKKTDKKKSNNKYSDCSDAASGYIRDEISYSEYLSICAEDYDL